MLEIIFADAKYFNKPEYVHQGHDGRERNPKFVSTVNTLYE